MVMLLFPMRMSVISTWKKESLVEDFMGV